METYLGNLVSKLCDILKAICHSKVQMARVLTNINKSDSRMLDEVLIKLHMKPIVNASMVYKTVNIPTYILNL